MQSASTHRYPAQWTAAGPAAPRVRGVRLAFGVIALNVVFQVVMFVRLQSGDGEPYEALTTLLWGGVGFYTVVTAVVVLPLMMLKPRWLRGNRQTAAIFGVEVGLAAAATLITLLWAGTGEPVLDPVARALVSEGSILRIVFAFVLIAGIAPVVEELLFRGVVAESLRHRGTVVALFVSSLLFALAHLGGLLYYTVGGVVLGLLYWKRGLWAAIAGHATFNGCLVVLAVVVAFGPARQIEDNGVTVRAPGDWQLAGEAAAPEGASLALEGPSGAAISVSRLSLPPDQPVVGAGQMAEVFTSGAAPLPSGVTIDPGTVEVVRYPAGEAVQMDVTVDGRDGIAVFIPVPGTLWSIEVATGGSDRAQSEYEEILDSMTLPER
jgi:membrane protease YdiL (CAAX protease family)